MKNHRLEGQMLLRLATAILLTHGALGIASATPVVFDFESFADGALVTNQIGGLIFSNTQVLQAGVSLNEFEFPPRSGTNVGFDDGGAVTIILANPSSGVGAFFNYAVHLTFAVYDASNNLLGSVGSAFNSNLALSGDVGSSSNEFVSFTESGGRIARVVITGDAGGASFTMDDLTIDRALTVPEPATVALVLGLLAFGCVRGGWLRQRGC